MPLTDTIPLGPLNIPLILIIAGLTAAIAYGAGALSLRREKENRRIFADLLFAPLLPFLIGWKFSLVLTDAGDVFAEPLLLLYGSGGTGNILIGSAAAAAWLAWRWNRLKPEKTVNKAMIRALATAAALAVLVSGAMIFSSGRSSGREKLPPVPLAREDGGSWDITSASGSPAVLNFWASWCPPCRAEMPMFERFQSDPRFSDVVFFAVNAVTTEKNPEAGRAWLDENSISLPLLYDTRGEAMNRYGIAGLPTTIVLDSAGGIVEMKTGAVSRSWLVAAIRKAD